jgi:hypothetical protein
MGTLPAIALDKVHILKNQIASYVDNEHSNNSVVSIVKIAA